MPTRRKAPAVPKSSASAAAAIRKTLLAAGEDLDKVDEGQILALGEDAVAPLIEILGDETLLEDDAPGEGMAPCHAAWLLGQLHAESAIEPLLDAVVDESASGLVRCNAAMQALSELGAAVVEPVLRRLKEVSLDARIYLCEILGRLGVQDARILKQLLALLKDAPEVGAACLVDYGDTAALPSLIAALDACKPTAGASAFENGAIVELYEAIEELGGKPTPAQRAKYALAASK